VARPGPSSWKIRSGRPRSFSRCTPRSASYAPSGRKSRTTAAAVSGNKTWLPYPTAATRAARCTSRPTRPVTRPDDGHEGRAGTYRIADRNRPRCTTAARRPNREVPIGICQQRSIRQPGHLSGGEVARALKWPICAVFVTPVPYRPRRIGDRDLRSVALVSLSVIAPGPRRRAHSRRSARTSCQPAGWLRRGRAAIPGLATEMPRPLGFGSCIGSNPTRLSAGEPPGWPVVGNAPLMDDHGVLHQARNLTIMRLTSTTRLVGQ